jgi:hypothetical protein
MSMHGRQLAINQQSGDTIFSVAKMSRIKTMSLRHNLEVCDSSGKEVRIPCSVRDNMPHHSVVRKHIYSYLWKFYSYTCTAYHRSHKKGRLSERLTVQWYVGKRDM